MPLVAADLARKHTAMASAPFPFMRATFYRWCERWHEQGDRATRGTVVLAVGDLHVENFGSWRDSEGRLIWGVNDFDEAAPLPWHQDLVRLAASAVLAARAEHLELDPRGACEALHAGYARSVSEGGEPFVLERKSGWLRRLVTSRLRSPVAFWRRMDRLPRTRTAPRPVVDALEAGMPARHLKLQLCRRTAGLGSLGRPRYVALADWLGGQVAREAKALAPSASTLLTGRPRRAVHYDAVLRTALRVPDPTVAVVDGWLVRRLAPFCTRIELAELPDDRDEQKLLGAMGYETANVHLGTTPTARRALARECRVLTPRRLEKLARGLADLVEEDWAAFRRVQRSA